MKRWPTKPLSEFAEVIRGVSFDKSQVFDSPGNNLVPILRAGNIQGSLLTDSDLVFVPARLVSPEQHMRRGDLAVCMSSGSPAIVGKSAHLEADWDGSVGAFCAIVRFGEKLQHRLGSYWFRSPTFMQWRDNNAKGANIQNLRRTELEKLPIPIPPLAEQERLVKLLDEADELRKLRAQADRRTADLTSALFHEMFGDPRGSSKGCQIEKLGAVTTFITSGSRGWARYYSETGARFIRVQNLEGHHLSFKDVAHVNPPDTAETRRTRVQSNDLLLAITGNTIGLSALVLDDVGEAYVSQHVAIIRLNQHVVSPYVASFMALPTGGQYQIAQMQYGHTKPGISLQQIREIHMPLPPLPLQQEFAVRVSEIRAMQTGQAASHRHLDDLFQSLLHRAFNDEL